ncbi:MAG: helix-turn-helix domain-containing protein [Coriobacteriales bacterium]
MNELARTLRREREQQGLSQDRLAKMAGTSQSRISAIERGVESLSVDKLITIAKCLGISTYELVKF